MDHVGHAGGVDDCSCAGHHVLLSAPISDCTMHTCGPPNAARKKNWDLFILLHVALALRATFQPDSQ